MDICRVGFLGFGNIGNGVFKILNNKKSEIQQRENVTFIIEKVLVKDRTKKREASLPERVYTEDYKEIVNNENISIIVEVMGGIEPARTYILEALKNGITVVTANKEVLALHWDEFEEAAKQSGAGLYFEASAAGGIPIIKVLRHSLQANNISSIMGIVNGTTNYILTKMSEDKRTFEDVLEEAKKLGYAEPNPFSDVSGLDVAYKLSILSSIAFHTRITVESIYKEGVTSITPKDIEYGNELGYTLKLLAIAKKTGNMIETRVHPTFINSNHPLASVRDSYNAVFIDGDAVGNLMLYGRGAGDLPTGSAIVSDVISAIKNRGRHSYQTFYNSRMGVEEVEFEDNWESEFFIRFTVKDNPGVLSKIAGIFGKYGVSIASVIQKERLEEIIAPLIFVTHRAKEKSISNAIKDIEKEDAVLEIGNVIRVEN